MKIISVFRTLQPFMLQQVLKALPIRVGTFLLAATLLLIASEGFAQNKTISLNFKDSPLSTIFKSITEQSGYTFLFNDDVNPNLRVSVNISSSSIEKAVSAILNNTGYHFSVKNKRIILYDQKQEKGSGKVTLRILNNSGTSLPGATVLVLGDKDGTIANNDGIAVLTITGNAPKKIQVSFIGYKTEELNWNGEKELICKLQEESKSFDEVIITGFSTVSKQRLTGSVSVVKSDDINKRINFDINSSLEGKVAGYNTYKGSSTIRGTTSFLSDAAPLVVVDGLPVTGDLSSINPNDVESITFLKDAATASIYGSRAANGIIVVVTKSGEKGKTTLDFSYSYSLTPKPRISDLNYASTTDIIDYSRSYMENAPEYKPNPLKYFQDIDKTIGYINPLNRIYYEELKGNISPEEKEAAIQQLKKYDYRKEYEKYVWRDRVLQQYNLAFRKGTDKMDVAFSANYQNQKYGTAYSNSDIITLNLKNKVNMYTWLNVTYGLYGNFSKEKSGLGGSATNFTPFIGAIMPFERLIDENGNRIFMNTINYTHNEWLINNGLYNMGYNALDEMEKSYNKTDKINLRGFAELDFNILKGLSYNLKFQYERNSSKSQSTYLKESLFMRDKINRFAVITNGKIRYIIPNDGRLFTSNADANNYTFRNQISFKRELPLDLTFDFFAGAEFRQYLTTGVSSDIYGYNPETSLFGQSVNWEEIQNGVYGALYPMYAQRTSVGLSSSYTLNREYSMYANGSLSYRGKYILAGSWRVDKANLFGADPKYRNRPLWSISGSWNASEESFLKQVSWINLLKVRMSYGINGNVDRSSSKYMLAYLGISYDVKKIAATIVSPPNESLRWEKTQIFNVGLDYNLFNGKWSGSFDYYNKYTSDLIAFANLDPSSGFSSASFNNGAMLNRGVEATLSYSWIRSKDWNVVTGITAAYNKNEVKKINYEPSSPTDLIYYPNSYYLIGDPFNSLYAYRYAGLTKEGDPSVYDKDGKVVENTNPMNDPKALRYMGTLDPKLTGGISQTVAYKNFSLDAQLVVYAGNKLRLDVTPLYGSASPAMNKDFVNRWTPDNTTSEIPRFPVYGSTGDRDLFWKFADRNVKDASMVKLRYISLSYALKAASLSRVKITSLQIKAQINNLWYWCAAGNSIDPENFSAVRGVRTGANKPSYLLAFNLTF